MPGRLTVIGLGPGSSALLAPMALSCLVRAGAVVGYDRYMELVDPDLLKGKTLFSSPMKKEMERTAKAVEFALAGLDTVVVSSGDSGIYGMAGLVLEFLEREGLLDTVELEVVPGIPALCAAAALLGAPLMHDFASISLSDLLTPLPTIMKRIRCAVEGDFVIALYNPKSRKRDSYLGQALAIATEHRGADTPVGFRAQRLPSGSGCPHRDPRHLRSRVGRHADHSRHRQQRQPPGRKENPHSARLFRKIRIADCWKIQYSQAVQKW